MKEMPSLKKLKRKSNYEGILHELLDIRSRSLEKYTNDLYVIISCQPKGHLLVARFQKTFASNSLPYLHADGIKNYSVFCMVLMSKIVLFEL